MRWAALGWLVGCLGCNQIFGLNQTILFDGSPDAPDGRVPIYGSLRWMIADGSSIPAADPLPQAAISPAPQIQLGPLGTGALSDVTYNAEGTFIIPFELPGQHWRVVYTLPSDPVPHEIQWQALNPQIVVAHTSRAMPAPVPALSKYEISPTPAVGFNQPTLMTSGIFTNTRVASGVSGNKVTIDFGLSAIPLLGSRGAPETAKGDWVMLANWVMSTIGDEARVTTLAWTNQLDLVAGASSTAAPTWQTNVVTKTIATNDIGTIGRMIAALGSLAPTSSYPGHLTYGVSPSLKLPPFMPPGAGASPFSVGLAETSPQGEVPLMLPLVDEAGKPISFQCLDLDPTQVTLPHVLYARLQNTRTTATGLVLTSSVAIVTDTLDVTKYPASLATGEKLNGVDLSSADGTAVTATSSPLTLTFVPDTGQGASADEFIVTLYEIGGTMLTRIRTYEVVLPSVQIDGSLLQVGHSYAFEITAHKGLPHASDGDLATVTYPFGSSTKFAGTVVIQ